MIEILIIVSMACGLCVFLWFDILRSRPSKRRRAIHLVLLGHVAGAAIVLLMVVILVIVELVGSIGMAGSTLDRLLASVLLWLLMSAIMAGTLVHNAKRGQRGIFGIFGRNVL